MSSTYGRTPLELPASMRQGLESMGYRLTTLMKAGLPVWRHRRHPALFFIGTPSRIPGETYVICAWQGQEAVSQPPDIILKRLARQIEAVEADNRILDDRVGEQ